MKEKKRERERDLSVWMTECACANYVRKSHARPPRGWPSAKSDRFNIILKYSVFRTNVRYVRAESGARDDFSDIRFAARSANNLINLSDRTANGRVNCSFFFSFLFS